MGTDLIDLKGVGPALVSKLQKLKVHNQYDLLFLLPIRYEDKTSLHKISALVAGEKALIQGFIVLTTVVYRGRRMLISQLSDDTGIITLRFFHFSKQQARRLAKNTVVRCFGQTRKTASGLEMIHPEYQIINPENPAPLEAGLTPIYPTTEGLQQGRLRKIVRAALEQQIDTIEELLPASVVKELGLVPLTESLREIHQPSQKNIVNDHQSLARKRLIIEELLANQLALKRLKRYTKKEPAMVLANRLLKESLIKNLPFKLTKSQARVVEEIEMDLKKNQPMMRLLQGDVGSGKTIVAALAMLIAVGSKQQAALMAPTELLAEQHFNTVVSWFEPLGVSVALLKSKLSAKDRRTVFAGVANGTIDIIVGTHALFQPSVVYKNLALVVVDEQHRFGVHQRLALREKGNNGHTLPHQLVMTATPIPRTLAMSAYADLECSVIDELPPGRTPVNTVVIESSRRDEVQERVRRACAEGQRAYWVSPLVTESDLLEAEAAIQRAKALTEELPNLRIALLHGRTPAGEKETVMEAFRAGRVDLLVATTVIEVGVDVPEASLMVIENAERLGLAQLHQLRGRIGRGGQRAVCVLLYRVPISPVARDRLATLRHTVDGFTVAQKDLELRGPGEVLGTRQSGSPEFRITNFVRHQAAVEWVPNAADQLLKSDPERVDALIERWLIAADRLPNV